MHTWRYSRLDVYAHYHHHHQVNGYLENLGTERLCDLKVTLSSGSPLGFEAAWPKWALQV